MKNLIKSTKCRFCFMLCVTLCFPHLGLANLLINSDYESGLAGWVGKGSSNVFVETTDVWEGSYSLRSTGRTEIFEGPSQDILSALSQSGPGTYSVSLAVKNLALPAYVKPTVRLKYGGVNYFFPYQENVGTSWTEVAGVLELNWNGTLQEAELYIANLNSNQDFLVDASSLDLEFITGVSWYVSPAGDDSNSGLSPSAPFRTIEHALAGVAPGDFIELMEGTYRSDGYDSVKTSLESFQGLDYSSIPSSIGEIAPSNAVAVIDVKGTSNAYITIRPYNNEAVRVQFNGAYGFLVKNAAYIIIEGLEIEGPSADITYSMADRNRTLRPRSSAFEGKGVEVSNSHHIIVRECFIHHCPGSGLRANGSDYIYFESNTVSHCNWWTPSGSSALVVAASRSYDNYEGTKIWVRRNFVHSNWNTQIFTLISRDPDDSSYGGPMDNLVRDGRGIYITRNNGTSDVVDGGAPTSYDFGKTQIDNNVAFNNGFGGLTYHKSDRGLIFNNTLIDNGVFPVGVNRSGANFNFSNDVEFLNNLILFSHGTPIVNVNDETQTESGSTDIRVNHNLFVGPSFSDSEVGPSFTFATTSNELLDRIETVNTLVDPDVAFETSFGDSHMESIFGVGNLPFPAILISGGVSTYNYIPKAGSAAIGGGGSVLGIVSEYDYNLKLTNSVDPDRGAYSYDQSVGVPYEDPRFLLRPGSVVNYTTFEPYGYKNEGTSLLANGGFEDDLTGWSSKSSATLAIDTGAVYANRKSLYVSGRTAAFSGPSQDITELMSTLGPGTYLPVGFVKNSSGSHNVRFTIRIKVDGVNTYHSIQNSIGDSWSELSGELNIDWSGVLQEAEFYIANDTVSESYYVDLLNVTYYETIEAEEGIMLGDAEVVSDLLASNGSKVRRLWVSDGSGVKFENCPASRVRVAYATPNYGILSFYINGVHARNLYIEPTGGWDGEDMVERLVPDVFLHSGDTLEIRKDQYDTAVNLDYIKFVHID